MLDDLPELFYCTEQFCQAGDIGVGADYLVEGCIARIRGEIAFPVDT